MPVSVNIFCLALFYYALQLSPVKVVAQSGAAQLLSNINGANGGTSRSGGTSGNGGGAGSGTAGNRNGNGGLPPGYANIRGEIMDMSNKLLQRITAAGTNYFTYENQNGAPLFRRREIDSNRRFVLFPDTQYPQGDGHYIVLRRMPGMIIPSTVPSAVYESFRLSLGDSIHAYVTEYKKDDKPPPNVNHNGFNGLQASYGGQTSGYSMSAPSSTMGNFMGKRRKRKSGSDEVEIEMTPMDFTKENQVQDVSSAVAVDCMSNDNHNYDKSACKTENDNDSGSF